MGTLEIIDKITNDEVNHFHDKLNIFNKSKKIKFLYLRCRDASSWITDTTQLWGPDIESEYIVDILTDDGRFDNIEFLSIPYNFDVRLLTKIDILAYSSNQYSVDYIDNIINYIHPSILLHLSDEHGTKSEYFKVFEKVNLVYRQYKFLHKKEYEKENMFKIRYLPIGYHSWGKNYHRQKNELMNRKYKWCFIGSLDKSNRMSQLQKLYVVEPYFCNTMYAFESTSIYRNSIFTFCPQGNTDLECSRSYEAMYNGCIPIIMGTTEQMDNLKNRFDIQLPGYFIKTLDEIIDIMKNTSMAELIAMQYKCYDWIRQNSEIIRVNIIASLNK
jgi:hypothetical protein